MVRGEACVLRILRYKPRFTRDFGRGLNGRPAALEAGRDGIASRLPVSPLSKLLRFAFQESSKRLGAGPSLKPKERHRHMPLYEHVFLARQDVSPQQVEQLVEQYKSLIEEQGGNVGKIENWGLRSLAYRINKNRKAHYTLMNITADPAAVAEMERQMRINEDVLRFMTIRVDAHEDDQSAMMQKRDRDDRRRGKDRDERGGGGGPRGGRRGDFD